MKRVNFSSVSLSALKEIVSLELVSGNYFDEWFSFDYKLSKDEENFLLNILNRLNYESRFKVLEVSEEEIKMKFISPILNQIYFVGKNYKDWYERTIKAKINGVLFSGATDFIVADGEFEPERPFFFIQEFKKSFKSNSPIAQILSEMMVALELGNSNIVRGAFIVGSIWQFIILEKSEERYLYSISKTFDSFELEDLKKIYSNLEAVKFLYCKN